MDFCKNRNSNSTSSNHSNSSQKSHNSQTSSNGGVSFNLEYCTSTSSLSPFGITTAVTPTIGIGNGSCSSSSVKSVKSAYNVALDEVLISSSGGSGKSNTTVTSKTSVRALSPPTTSTASRLLLASSQNLASKRKRRSSVCFDDKDPEIGFGQPIAKRQQRLPSLCASDHSSVVSSVYPSPPVEGGYINDIDACSSSDCISSIGNSTFDRRNADILQSPESPEKSDCDATPGAYDGEEEEVIEETLESDNDLNDDVDHLHDVGADTNSSSPPSICSHDSHIVSARKGERTPCNKLHCTEVLLDDFVQPKVQSFDDFVNAHYDLVMTPAADQDPPRQCPLPALSWANAHDVWQLMCKKDEQDALLRDALMLEQHPGLQPRMRAILLDWLIEVCEVYKLHRETYYLAVDYLDRYLTAQKMVQKTHLQLIGITCLFVAAKVEEIYPPKIGEFAYVTDGACQESDILQHEILLLQTLDWNISPVTPMGWLGVYMQLNVSNRTPASLKSIVQQARLKKSSEVDNAFIYPQVSGYEFMQTAQLLDLCSLDVGISNFPYSVLAAAAMSHTFDTKTVLSCSGLDWQTIEPCARWMSPFFQSICDDAPHLHLMEQNEQIASKYGLGHICPNIVTDDSHIIQTHAISLQMFERASDLQEHIIAMTNKMKQEASPATGLLCPEGLLTPPASLRKPFDADVEPEANVMLSDLVKMQPLAVDGTASTSAPASTVTENSNNKRV